MLSARSIFHDLSGWHAPELQNVRVSPRVKVFEQKMWLSAATDLIPTPTKILKMTCKRVHEIDFKTYICKETEFLMLFSVGESGLWFTFARL